MRKHLTNRCKYDKLTNAPDAATHREIFGGVAQLGERTVRIRKVRSSILPVSTKQVKGEPISLGRWIRLYHLFLGIHMQSHRRFPACGFVILGIP